MNDEDKQQSLEQNFITELIKKGLIVASVTATGNFILGDVAAVLAGAISAIVAFIPESYGASARSIIQALQDNYLVKILNILNNIWNLPWERIWQGLQNIVKFLSRRNPSGS